MLHFMARRTTTRYPQAGAKALTSPRVPPILFSFSNAPMTATDFGFNTVRNDSRNTSFIAYPPKNISTQRRGAEDAKAAEKNGNRILRIAADVTNSCQHPFAQINSRSSLRPRLPVLRALCVNAPDAVLGTAGLSFIEVRNLVSCELREACEHAVAYLQGGIPVRHQAKAFFRVDKDDQVRRVRA